MTDFGDDEPDDQFSTEGELDPFQVAMRLHELRERRLGSLVPWDDLSRREQDFSIGVMAELIDWLRREGALRG